MTKRISIARSVASTAAVVCAAPICLPLLGLWKCAERYSAWRHEQFVGFEPKPLPAVRKPLLHFLRKPGRNSAQSGSPLFKLPLEIREQIYSYLVPIDDRLLLVHGRNGLHLTELKAKDMLLGSPSRRLQATLRHERAGDFYNLLRVCHTLSKELTQLVFTHNTFYFGSPNAFTSFCNRANFESLQLLRDIRLDIGWLMTARPRRTCVQRNYFPRFKSQDWKQACELLITLPAIRTLQVSLRLEWLPNSWSGYPFNNRRNELFPAHVANTMLDPMKAVMAKHTCVFEYAAVREVFSPEQCQSLSLVRVGKESTWL